MCHKDNAYALIRWQHFVAWNDVMAAILKVWYQIENLTCQSMDIYMYLKNIPAKFHTDPISNDEVLGHYEDGLPNKKNKKKKNNNKMTNDTKSVPDPKIEIH